LKKKPVFLQIMGLLVLYAGIFVVLVIIQFREKGSFTQKIGRAVVSGQRWIGEGERGPANPDEILLAGGVSVFFGGLEFRLGEEEEGFALIDRAGNRHPAAPEGMQASGDSVSFRFSGGTELAFATQYAGTNAELRISGRFSTGAAGADIPFRPLRSSRIREGGDGQLTVSAAGATYVFSRLNGQGEMVIPLRTGGGPVVYRAAPEKRAFAPADFVLPQVSSLRGYGDYIARWQDQSFSLWTQIAPGQNDEDTVIAYSGEAVRRGVYKAAVSAVSPAFLEGSRRTYESSVYLGGMRQALQSFTGREREKINRLSRQINEKSPDFLRDNRAFEFLAARSYGSFVDDGIVFIRSLDPASLTLELIPGVFEGWMDLKEYRPQEDNPFDRLIDQACYVVSEGVRKADEIYLAGRDGAVPQAGNWVFVFQENSGDMEFNLRLGKALLNWAETSGRGDWAGLGRSLVVSVLSLTDSAGTVPRSIEAAAGGEIRETPGPRISAARLYRLLCPGQYYPRPARIGSGAAGIWTWTAASALGAVQDDEGKVLDISVSFPPGETHYMMIRGIRPFVKIQLYDMDYRTDPEFERYDSSGWIYAAADQILVLKMKHRAAVEHIKIFY
jgi:hypothetical protein